MNQLSTKLKNPTRKEVVKELERYVTSLKLFTADAEQDTYALLRHVRCLKLFLRYLEDSILLFGSAIRWSLHN